MGSSFLSEVHYASDQEGAPRPVTSYLLLPPLPQVTLPRSGYRGSDFVQWHRAGVPTLTCSRQESEVLLTYYSDDRSTTRDVVCLLGMSWSGRRRRRRTVRDPEETKLLCDNACGVGATKL